MYGIDSSRKCVAQFCSQYFRGFNQEYADGQVTTVHVYFEALCEVRLRTRALDNMPIFILFFFIGKAEINKPPDLVYSLSQQKGS
jgi:hypothetical protein